MICKMLVLTILLLWLISSTQGDDLLDKFNQNAYKIKDVRAEVYNYDKNKMNHFDIKTFKYNRTISASNASLNFKIDVQDKLEVVVQFYKLASNQFRTFPIRFRVNAQKALNANIGGLMVIEECGNIQQIYFLKDITYYTCNVKLDANKLPPLIPTGQYKVEVDGLYLENNIFKVNGYLEIYIPIKYPSSK